MGATPPPRTPVNIFRAPPCGTTHPNANMSAKKMAAIHWLDLLEKEFDKAFVDLDILLGEVDPDQCEITYEGRRKMTALSAAFAQLCHKAQTIFQNNAKLEAQVMNLRADVCEVRAT